MDLGLGLIVYGKFCTGSKNQMDFMLLHFPSFRATACTKMNDMSSRSHAIFTITFTQVSSIGSLLCIDFKVCV